MKNTEYTIDPEFIIEAKALEVYTDFKAGEIVNLPGMGEVRMDGYDPTKRKYPYLVESVKTAKRNRVCQKRIDARS
jgi:hypothetical protein